jgi:hypothetical protein
MTEQLCVICGIRNAVTKDHVPPRGIFAKPRPNNLIKVPSCFPCNNNASDLDERFRVYLGLHVAGTSDNRNKQLMQEGLRTLRHNRKLYRTILRGLSPVYLTTPEGIIFERGHKLTWDSEAHDAVVERTSRGLYYHHYREILGQ